jgi:hypothetical protein
MLKPFSTYAHAVLALALILPLASLPVDARPSSSSSFKSGFSSQRSSSSSSSSSSKSSKSSGSFGSFSRKSAADARKSDSALSRKLDKERADANALRTLDERRAAQAARDGRNQARPAPEYDRRAPQQGNGYGYGNASPPAQPPVIVNNNGGSGLGHVVAGAILARQAANAHANDNHADNGNGNSGGYYPAPDGSAGDLANQAGANSVGGGAAAASAAPAPAARDSGGSLFGTFAWLCVLSLVGWCVYFAWKRAKVRRAAGKPNYSFERN